MLRWPAWAKIQARMVVTAQLPPVAAALVGVPPLAVATRCRRLRQRTQVCGDAWRPHRRHRLSQRPPPCRTCFAPSAASCIAVVAKTTIKEPRWEMVSGKPAAGWRKGLAATATVAVDEVCMRVSQKHDMHAEARWRCTYDDGLGVAQ